uniref:Polysaccharide export protein n=1 Tax=Chlorobium phaeovibrioides (strain DSM 265 / 1930) TaxID=290318 RepID=A4SDR6_CHLPM
MRYRQFIVAAAMLVLLPAGLFAENATTSGSASSAAQTGSMMVPSVSSFVAPGGVQQAMPIPQSTMPAQSALVDDNPVVSDAQIAGPSLNITSSFQEYVSATTGSALPVFGRNLFKKVPSTYAPLNAVQVNADYVIGPGDVLRILGWGMIDVNISLAVNRDGTIYLPRVGQIHIAGVRYRDLDAHLRKAVGRVFTNFELSATVARTRSVQIYVTGHALRPGTYTLSAMSSLLNALFASGGPSVTGSMRTIKLKRSGSPLVSFDLYDILLHGNTSSDLSLRDGDVIYIPAIGPQVAVFGDVKQPAIFELKENASVADLLMWSGGFESAADLTTVIVEKNVDHRYKTIKELKADWISVQNELAKLPLVPTDIIRIVAPSAVPIQAKIERAFVRVDGSVKQNGVFELQPSETLKSLMVRIGGISKDGYVYGAQLNRESVRREQQVKIDEAVDRYEKEIDISVKQRLKNATDQAETANIKGEYEASRNLVRKLRAVKSQGRIILDISSADAGIDALPDFPLQDGDRIYIPERPSTVDVIGAVYQQNTFIFKDDRSVSNYLALAGGVSPTGDRGEVYRICADGTVKSRRHKGGSDVSPGDAIVVPEKLSRGKSLTQSLKDWTTILYQFGLGAAGLNALK